MGDQFLYHQRLGQAGPQGTLIFLHATGINGTAYRPFLESLDWDGEILAFTLRGHGKTTLPAEPGTLQSFQTLADDVVKAVRALAPQQPLSLMGHSAGAVSALIAARELSPERVILLEPVVLPRVAVWMANSPLKPFTIDRIPIAKAAAARRSQFPSREAAKARYQQKPFFAAWHPDALDGYLDEGLVETGEGVKLACDPAYEATVFRAQRAGFWPHLRAVHAAGASLSIVVSEKNSTFPAALRPQLKYFSINPKVWPGGHMFPLENPGDLADWVSEQTKV